MINRLRRLILATVCLAFLASCGVSNTWYSKKDEDWKEETELAPGNKVKQTIFLIGDAGKPDTTEQIPVFKLLERKLKYDTTSPTLAEVENRSIVFLGDNIYDLGLPPEDDNGYPLAEARLREQLDIMKDVPGTKLMVAGNHDWQKSRSRGWEYVVRQQEFVDAYLDSSVFQPKGGCPGPVEIDIDENTVIIAFDSEWWLFEHDRPEGVFSFCDVQDEYDFITQFKQSIDRNSGKNILVVMHHPLMSNSNHGGHFSLGDYMFPLTLVKDNLYIPLPVIGAIYPLARKYGISQEDIPNPHYQKLIDNIVQIIDDEPNVVVATGHDHNLQLHKRFNFYHIVSGSGTKEKFVKQGRDAEFIAKRKGFTQINYYENGECWVEFWSPSENDPNIAELLFTKPMYAIPPKENPEVREREIPDYRDSIIELAIAPEYRAGNALQRLLLGKTYRDLWAQPVKFNYVDLIHDKQGLQPIKLGGGKQTSSLRLASGDGNQYTLRSVNKDPISLLPVGLHSTWAEDVIQDQMSSSHPYGALVVPGLAEAVDVYHTNPELLYVPYSPSFGQYLNVFGGMIVLREIRPDENLSEFRRFGKSKNVVSTQRMLEQLDEDNDNEVDSKDFLRARMLDLFIGDWDRHEDQWRWAEYDKDGDGEVYRPIPRDRDQTFVRYDGLVAKLVISRFGERRLTHFDDKIVDVVGLMTAGGYLDRRLLSDLSKEEWTEIVKEMQVQLTDEVIEEAIKRMPPEICAINGEDLNKSLKARRDDLLTYALDYYEYLNKNVDITLSDKNELVKIKRKNNGEAEIKVYKRDLDPEDKEIEQLLYSRSISYKTTQEIRIYCMAGRDSILIEGKTKHNPEIRIIGGAGIDYFKDESKVRGIFDKTSFYDLDNEVEANTIIKGRETNIRTDDNIRINRYNSNEFKPNTVMPLVFLQYDRDYGVFVGGGAKITTHGFRQYPYKTMQEIKANYAFKTGAFNVQYEGDYPSLIRTKNGLNMKVDLDGPDYLRNYFGQGNESEFQEEEDIFSSSNPSTNFRVGLNYYRAKLGYTYRPNAKTYLAVGPSFEYAKVFYREDAEGQNYAVDEGLEDGQEFHLAGVFGEMNLNYTDSDVFPKRGLKWENELHYRRSTNVSDGFEFGKYISDFKFYITPVVLPFDLTIALRAGGELTLGETPFYQSAMIGGGTNLRGYRRLRFAGNDSFYQSVEARLRLTNISGYLVAGSWGVYGFLDNGRVWAVNSTSKKWHQGYGGGLYLNMYDLFVVNAGIGHSEEGNYINLKAGFFF